MTMDRLTDADAQKLSDSELVSKFEVLVQQTNSQDYTIGQVQVLTKNVNVVRQEIYRRMKR